MSGIDTEHIRGLLEPVLAAAGFELVDVLMSAGTLQVLVDVTDPAAVHGVRGGIDLDGVAAATRLVDAALDASDPITQRYTLEVSSPGLERPLRTPSHFRRYVGTTVSVKTVAGTPGDRRVEGVLRVADPEAAGGIEIGGRRIAYAEIERARSVFTWGAQPKPGKGARSAKSASAADRDIETADDFAAAMGDRLGLDDDEIDQLADLREDRHHGTPGSELHRAELDDLREWEGLAEDDALDLDDALESDDDPDADDLDPDDDDDVLDDLDGFDHLDDLVDLERLDAAISSARLSSAHVASSTKTAEAVNPKGDKR